MPIKYRIYCNDKSHEGYQFVWSNEPPTKCPKNSKHKVNKNSIKPIAKEKICFTEPVHSKIKSKHHTRVFTVPFQNVTSSILRVKVMAHMDSGASSYSLELFDHVLSRSLLNKTFTNTSLDLVDLGIIELNKNEDYIFDINALIISKSKLSKKHVYIERVIFYSEHSI